MLIGSSSKAPLSPQAKLDLEELALLTAHIRGSGEMRKELARFTENDGQDPVEMISENITRWEGRVKALKRVKRLKDPLTEMWKKGHFRAPIAKAPNSFPADFFEDSFWTRLLNVYYPLLKSLNMYSKLAQHQDGPTLSGTPLWVHQMMQLCVRSEEDGATVASFKGSLLQAITARMSFYLLPEGPTLCQTRSWLASLIRDIHYHCVRFTPKLGSNSWLNGSSKRPVFCTLKELEKWPRAHCVPQPNLCSKHSKLLACPQMICLSTALDWWRTFQANDEACFFVMWGEGAKMFLAMPAGGAPSEFMFSRTGRFITKLRTRMGDVTLEMCLLINHYVHSNDYDFNLLMQRMEALIEASEAATNE